MKKLSGGWKTAIVACSAVALAAGVHDAAAASLETYYSAPGANIGSFDWGADGSLYYLSFADDYSGSSFERHAGGGTSTLFTFSGYAGSSVVAVGDSLFFNGSDGSWQDFIYRYDVGSGQVQSPATPVASYGLYFQNSTLFISSGSFTSPGTDISVATFDGSWSMSATTSIGSVAGYSGPMGFDSAGNFYYASGYQSHNLYRWEAADVALALAGEAPLGEGGLWFDLNTKFAGLFDGATGMAFDDEGNIYLTLTVLGPPGAVESQLVRLSAEGDAEVIYTSEGRLGELRFHDGGLYVAEGGTIYAVSIPEPGAVLFGVMGGFGVLAWQRRRVAL